MEVFIYMAQKKVVYLAEKYLAHKGAVIAIGEEVKGLTPTQIKALSEKGFIKKADAEDETDADANAKDGE